MANKHLKPINLKNRPAGRRKLNAPTLSACGDILFAFPKAEEANKEVKTAKRKQSAA